MFTHLRGLFFFYNSKSEIEARKGPEQFVAHEGRSGVMNKMYSLGEINTHSKFYRITAIQAGSGEVFTQDMGSQQPHYQTISRSYNFLKCHLECGDPGSEQQLCPSSSCSWQKNARWSGQKSGRPRTVPPTVKVRCRLCMRRGEVNTVTHPATKCFSSSNTDSTSVVLNWARTRNLRWWPPHFIRLKKNTYHSFTDFHQCLLSCRVNDVELLDRGELLDNMIFFLNDMVLNIPFFPFWGVRVLFLLLTERYTVTNSSHHSPFAYFDHFMTKWETETAAELTTLSDVSGMFTHFISSSTPVVCQTCTTRMIHHNVALYRVQLRPFTWGLHMELEGCQFLCFI